MTEDQTQALQELAEYEDSSYFDGYPQLTIVPTYPQSVGI